MFGYDEEQALEAIGSQVEGYGGAAGMSEASGSNNLRFLTWTERNMKLFLKASIRYKYSVNVNDVLYFIKK